MQTEKGIIKLHYSLIITTYHYQKLINKYRNKIIYNQFRKISPFFGVKLLRWHYYPEYIQATFSGQLSTKLQQMIGAIKSTSSRKIQSSGAQLKNHQFWNHTYCLTTKNTANHIMPLYLKQQQYHPYTKLSHIKIKQ